MTEPKNRDTCEELEVHCSKIDEVRGRMPDDDTIYDLAELFKVFGDSTRTRILSALFLSELCVCDISQLLSMSVSAVSHQLRILRHAKLVKSRRNGKEVFYSLDDGHIGAIFATALEHLKEGTDTNEKNL